MDKIHLWQEPVKYNQDTLTTGITIELPNGKRLPLWYQLPIKYQNKIPSHCNSFVLAALFLAMDYPAELVVHGEVDRSLLQNLIEFQIAWSAWQPQYQVIEITVDREITPKIISSLENSLEKPLEIAATLKNQEISKPAIMAFSGGVDSCFTLGRHTKFNIGRQHQNLQAGVMVHGFDIPLDQPEVFAKALVRSQIILDSVGVELIPIATNFRELDQDWEDVHGAAIVSCLMFLENIYPLGLVASGPSYKSLVFPQGSNPLTDRYLSSSSFSVIHDGAGSTRLAKIQAISDWPEVREHLRVCWQGAELDKNCCQCEKCIRSILSFRAVGAGLPSCFPVDVTPQQINVLQVPQAQLEVDFVPILNQAKARGIDQPWVKSLESCIRRHERGYAIKAMHRFLRQQIPPKIKKPLWQVRRRLIGR
jgi:hypothetical protein